MASFASPRIGLVAGEASGDTLGGGLIAAIGSRVPDARFMGVAGPRMVSMGCEAWYRAEELSVMGLAEVLRHLPRLLRLRRDLLRRFRAADLDVFVGIDSPDFNLPPGSGAQAFRRADRPVCQSPGLGLAAVPGGQYSQGRGSGVVPAALRGRVLRRPRRDRPVRRASTGGRGSDG